MTLFIFQNMRHLKVDLPTLLPEGYKFSINGTKHFKTHILGQETHTLKGYQFDNVVFVNCFRWNEKTEEVIHIVRRPSTEFIYIDDWQGKRSSGMIQL